MRREWCITLMEWPEPAPVALRPARKPWGIWDKLFRTIHAHEMGPAFRPSQWNITFANAPSPTNLVFARTANVTSRWKLAFAVRVCATLRSNLTLAASAHGSLSSYQRFERILGGIFCQLRGLRFAHFTRDDLNGVFVFQIFKEQPPKGKSAQHPAQTRLRASRRLSR